MHKKSRKTPLISVFALDARYCMLGAHEGGLSLGRFTTWTGGSGHTNHGADGAA